MFLLISDNTKNKQFQGDVRQNPGIFYVFKRRHFLICWLMLPADLKNRDFKKKKKKKKRILPDTTAKLFIFVLTRSH